MKLPIITACFLIGLFSSLCLHAQPKINGFKLLSRSVKVYEKAEWDIKVSAAYINPYDQKDITLNLLLTSPSGKPIVLPCYYENGDTTSALWKARFTPQETGKYSYTFSVHNIKGEATSAAGYFVAAPSSKPGFLHKNSFWTFKFDNGQLFRGIGENVGWESRSFEDPKWTYDYLLPTLAKNGANFFRTWMCYWNMPLEWQKVDHTKRYTNTDKYFNPGAIKRMDELVNLTDSLGLYFMLTLDWHGHLMEAGGWKNSPYNVLNGGPAKTPVDFFTMRSARDKYKNKLRYVIARWGYSTNIAAFEFFNEIDNAAFNAADSIIIPHSAIVQWHDEMSRYLKDIDPYRHMVTTSVSHRDIIGMNSLAYIDFNQKHIYKHTEKIPAIYPDYIHYYNKPYVVGEFGFRWEDDNPQYGEGFDYDYKRGLWYGLFSPTPLLPMTWWWELFDTRGMTPYFNGVRQISDQMLKAGKGSFEPFTVTASQIESYGVKCGNKYFIYLLNNTDEKIISPISFTGTAKAVKGQSFNPATRQYETLNGLTLVNGKVSLKSIALAAKQEMVLVITE
ncbi:DUF5060 domain-containing protein [Mucilaginibacter sp.]|uniref:DUF5060 domain-containing protein n=1 Tax=Mucilaginibacter sp. TaxID=1882438 RepID=UPI003D0F0ADB